MRTIALNVNALANILILLIMLMSAAVKLNGEAMGIKIGKEKEQITNLIATCSDMVNSLCVLVN